MSRKRWEPFEELKRIREEIDRMIEDFLKRPREAIERMAIPSLEEPLIDVYEVNNEVVIVADLPGIEKEKINVNATEDSVEINAEIKRLENIERISYIKQERKYERFYRKISLPVKVKPEYAKSKYENGVLEIRLPKLEVKKGVKIRVE
ncbi:MAG: Hsp20/alpha crystallin family protein [Candidatus Bathyarchaeia archaeon]